MTLTEKLLDEMQVSDHPSNRFSLKSALDALGTIPPMERETAEGLRNKGKSYSRCIH